MHVMPMILDGPYYFSTSFFLWDLKHAGFKQTRLVLKAETDCSETVEPFTVTLDDSDHDYDTMAGSGDASLA